MADPKSARKGDVYVIPERHGGTHVVVALYEQTGAVQWNAVVIGGDDKTYPKDGHNIVVFDRDLERAELVDITKALPTLPGPVVPEMSHQHNGYCCKDTDPK